MIKGTNMYKKIGLKNSKTFILFFFVIVSIIGCGNDESSPSPVTPDVPASSAVITSSADIALSSFVQDTLVVEVSSSSVLTINSVGSSVFSTTLAGATPDADGFYDIGVVYNAAPTTSKIAFVIRHSKREKNNLGQESTLTPIGVEKALAAGAKLAGDESFYYASTDFVRTKETCRNIALGRGEENPEINVWDGINGGYFLTVPTDTMDALMSTRGGSSRYIAQWAYGVPLSNRYVAEHASGYFYDLFERGNQFVNEIVVANMPKWKRVSILATHDLLVEPLIVYVSNRTIDLKVYESFKWVNYLSGIAVIVDEVGAVTVLPVRGDEVGWMIPRDEIIEE